MTYLTTLASDVKEELGRHILGLPDSDTCNMLYIHIKYNLNHFLSQKAHNIVSTAWWWVALVIFLIRHNFLSRYQVNRFACTFFSASNLELAWQVESALCGESSLITLGSDSPQHAMLQWTLSFDHWLFLSQFAAIMLKEMPKKSSTMERLAQ